MTIAVAVTSTIYIYSGNFNYSGNCIYNRILFTIYNYNLKFNNNYNCNNNYCFNDRNLELQIQYYNYDSLFTDNLRLWLRQGVCILSAIKTAPRHT